MLPDPVLFIGLAIDGFILFFASLQFMPWPLQKERACRYEPLAERTCNAFPEPNQLSVIGARFESLSSLMFIGGAFLGAYFVGRKLYNRDGNKRVPSETIAALGYFLTLGIANFGFWATHCYDWWRLDINLARAFPCIVGLTLLCIKIDRLRKFSVLGAFITLIPLVIILPVGWHNTQISSAGFFVVGCLLLGGSLIWAFRKGGRDVPTLTWLTIVLVFGGAMLWAQSADTLCVLRPAALGHTVLGFVPPLLALLE
jgi:hypothetical protein